MTLMCAVFSVFLASCPPSAEVALPGYVEGTYVRLSPQVAGRIQSLSVDSGGAVAEGQELFRLDPRAAQIDFAVAKAALAEATALYQDRARGGSEDEVTAAQAVVDSLQAELMNAQADLERATGLWEKSAISKSKFEAATLALDVTKSRLDAAQARFRLVKSGLRSDQLEALRQRMVLAEAQLDKAKWQLDQTVVVAPARGTVDAILGHAGEAASPGTPVLSILTEGSTRIIFFPNGTERSAVKPGDVVGVRCGGCDDGVTATVTLVSAHAEFTPPQIFTTDRQSMLAYRVEARVDRDVAGLAPGVMVDLILPGEVSQR